jgi:hypothetical protein
MPRSLNTGPSRELTIASGAITVTGRDSFITIDTEADAATDDLDTITGGITGQTLIIRTVTGGRDVTLKDEVDNLSLAGDFTLTRIEDTIVLFKGGTNWLEISRSDNS